MPHIPDLRSHADHDLELVAAYAAGDAAGADLETATALVAGCAACAQLHHDLRAIAAAMPELPAPVRPRDFRLTAGQAAALRPGGWRGALAAFAGPRFRLAGPVGAGLATLGIAGILLGSIASVPLGAGGAATADDASRYGTLSGAAPELASAAPSAADKLSAEGPATVAPAASANAGAAALPASSNPDQPAAETAPVPMTVADQGSAPSAWLGLSIIILVIGIGLVGARLVGRRLSRAP